MNKNEALPGMERVFFTGLEKLDWIKIAREKAENAKKEKED